MLDESLRAPYRVGLSACPGTYLLPKTPDHSQTSDSMPIPPFGASRQTNRGSCYTACGSVSWRQPRALPSFCSAPPLLEISEVLSGLICITSTFHGYHLSGFVYRSAKASDNIPKVWTASGRVKPATRWGTGRRTPLRGAAVPETSEHGEPGRSKQERLHGAVSSPAPDDRVCVFRLACPVPSRIQEC